MKRKPFSELGYHIQRRREDHLLRRRKLAALADLKRKNGSWQNNSRLLEEQGVVDRH